MKLLLNLFILFTASCFGQTIQRQSTSTLGSSNNVGGVSISQSIGQPYQTQTSQSENISIRPGFQQSMFTADVISSSVDVNIFPNPFIYSFVIESSVTLENAELSAFDVSGKLIYSEKIASFKKHEVMCGNWANGLYVVKITDPKGNLISTKVNKIQ